MEEVYKQYSDLSNEMNYAIDRRRSVLTKIEYLLSENTTVNIGEFYDSDESSEYSRENLNSQIESLIRDHKISKRKFHLIKTGIDLFEKINEDIESNLETDLDQLERMKKVINTL